MPSIEKRGENTWRLTVELGRDANGKRIRKRKNITITDKALLKTTKKLNEFLEAEWYKFKSELESGNYYSPEKMYFRDFVNEWLEKYIEPKIKDGKFAVSTKVTYLTHLNNHILPAFGHMRLDQIHTMHILDFFTKLREQKTHNDKPMSTATLEYIYRILKNVLDRAVEWKIIPENPINGVERPKPEKRKPNFYEEHEAQEVILALYKEPIEWRLYFLGAMLGGFRRGELVALEWPDVDFENNTFTIRKSISMTIDGQAIEGGPKAKSEGVVVMPEWYMQELKKYYLQWKKDKLMAGDAWEGGDKQYVFHAGLGKPYYYKTPTNRWRKFIKRNNLKYIRLHDLRHTAATLLIEAGVDLKTIQERLRHSRYQTTADIYAHVTKKVQKETAEKLDKFNPAKLIK